MTYFNCDTRVASDFPSLLTTVSVSNIAYALHVSVAASTLFLLVTRENQNPHRTKHIVFIALLLAAGTANIILYLLATARCDQEVRQYNSESLQDALRWCLDKTTNDNATACADLDSLYDGYFGRYSSPEEVAGIVSGQVEFPGPDLTRGQDSTALFIAILAQSYLLVRVHLLLGRKLLTGIMAFVSFCVITCSIVNITFLSTGAYAEGDFLIGYLDQRIVSQLSLPFGNILAWTTFGLALTFNLLANILIIGRLLTLRARVRAVLGQGYSKIYTGLASVVLESSVLYTTVLIVAYTSLPGNGGTWNLFSPLVAQTEAIAAELITLRIALGRAMSRKEVLSVTTRHADGPIADSEAAELKSQPSNEIVQSPALSGNARRVRIQETFSQFPSSVAAVLKSNRTQDTDTGTGSVS